VSQRHAFLKALKENEDDISMRLVYSDWLDEQGEHEEADRQRQWPAAKAWLVRFCRDYNPADETDPNKRVISYEELILRARLALEGADDGELAIHCGNNMDIQEALNANRLEFWQNCSIVTGILAPPDAAENSSFTCAC
jgi:uncharacterized protein (TIGR02996 family)